MCARVQGKERNKHIFQFVALNVDAIDEFELEQVHCRAVEGFQARQSLQFGILLWRSDARGFSTVEGIEDLPSAALDVLPECGPRICLQALRDTEALTILGLDFPCWGRHAVPGVQSAMKMRVKIYFHQQQAGPPKLLNPIDIEDDALLENLHNKLEQLNVFKRLGPFQFWDVEEDCRIYLDFEALNSIRESVHLITVEENCYESSKRPRVGNVVYGGESMGIALELLEFPTCPIDPSTADNLPMEPISATTSEERSITNGPALQSTLLPNEVLRWYIKGERKLQQDLKQVSMEDHEFSLRSWDHCGAAVVKLYYCECRYFTGRSAGKYTKGNVTNLFSNFRKSHLNSARHIRSYCRQKGIDFVSHPQVGTTRNNPIIITAIDHKRMVEEGIATVATVNDSIDPVKPTFQLIGDLSAAHIKCYWYKVKCLFCSNEVLQLCPPKKNLKVNLMNHVHGTVHTKLLEELKYRSLRESALSTSKRGRPTRSSTSSGQASQKALHSFFKHREDEMHTNDRNSVSLQMYWGLRRPYCLYTRKSYAIESLLIDPHLGKLWYPEPFLEASLRVDAKDGEVVVVMGAFRYKSCSRVSMSGEPFVGFTCSMCCSIVLEPDFRLRVVRKEHAVEKRGFRDTMMGD